MYSIKCYVYEELTIMALFIALSDLSNMIRKNGKNNKLVKRTKLFR